MSASFLALCSYCHVQLRVFAFNELNDDDYYYYILSEWQESATRVSEEVLSSRKHLSRGVPRLISHQYEEEEEDEEEEEEQEVQQEEQWTNGGLQETH